MIPAIPGLDVRRRLSALAAGLAISLGLAAFDYLGGRDMLVIGTVVLGPFVTAVLGGPRETAVVAAVAAVLAVLSGAWNHNVDTSAYYLRVGVVVVGGMVSLLAANARSRSAVTGARFDLLAAVSRVADGGGGLEHTVDRLNTLIVPAFADLSILDVTRGDRLERLSVRAHGLDATRQEAFLELRGAAPPEGSVASFVALGTVEPQLIEGLSDATLRDFATDDEDLAGLKDLGITSSVVVPLRARRRALGALSLSVGRVSGRTYRADDLAFFEVLAGRVALALDNAGLTRQVFDLERQLDSALGCLAQAVTVVDHEGRPVYANQAAVELIGVASAEEFCAAEPGELMDRFDVYDEAGHPVSLEELPAFRVLAGEHEVPPLLVRNVVRATGEERWLVNRTSPVSDDEGRIVRVVNVIDDITELKRAERASRILAQASEVLSSSLDLDLTLQGVAEMAVPELADWCALSMPDQHGFIRQVAVAHTDIEKVALARRLGELYPEPVEAPAGTAAVIRAGVSQWANEIPAQTLVEAAHDEEHLELLRSLGLRAAMIVPMTASGRSIGALTLVSAESGRSFTEGDVQLAEELARRAGTAVENARLYTERSAIAATLQQGLRPPELEEIPGWAAATLYRPAGELNEVGGDFYDLFPVPGGFMTLIGDVVGQGAAAATLTSLARFTLRTAGELTGDPAVAAARLNAALRRQPVLSLCTAICALVEESADGRVSLRMATCGHPLPLLIREGSVSEIGEYGRLAGVFDGEIWPTTTVDLLPGDTLVFYTDGVTDTVGNEQRFGEQRLLECLAAGPSEPAELIDHVARSLDAFQEGAQSDDTAVLALRLVGVPALAPAEMRAQRG